MRNRYNKNEPKIYFAKGGKRRVVFWKDGKRVEKVCDTKIEAENLKRAIVYSEDLSYWFPERDSKRNSAGTFADLAGQWLKYTKDVRKISDSCLWNYESHLNLHILPVIGSRLLKDLRPIDIEEVASAIARKKPQTRSYKTIRKRRAEQEFFENDEFLSVSYQREILTVACMVTKYGFRHGMLQNSNPFEKFDLPQQPEQPYDYWRSEDEDKFLTWLENGGPFCKKQSRKGSKATGKPEFYLRPFKMRPGKAEELYQIVLFALRSGLRKGEIGALRRQDVDFSANQIIVRRSFSEKENRIKNTTKGKSYRRIEMNEDMKEILKSRIWLVDSDDDLLFNIKSWCVKNFSKYCALAEVREIHFHSLRHTCLTNLANGYGMDKPLPLPQVQVIAGHRDITTTQRYIHTHGIENTTSLQWSRSQRKAKSQPEAIRELKGLKLITSN